MVLPSVWPEAFGKVGIEVMSVGRPVIGTDVGGISEWLVDGKTGRLVPPRDSKAIAVTVNAIFSDHTIFQEMSINARKQAERFSIEAHAQAVVEVYSSLIRKSL